MGAKQNFLNTIKHKLLPVNGFANVGFINIFPANTRHSNLKEKKHK